MGDPCQRLKNPSCLQDVFHQTKGGVASIAFSAWLRHAVPQEKLFSGERGYEGNHSQAVGAPGRSSSLARAAVHVLVVFADYRRR